MSDMSPQGEPLCVSFYVGKDYLRTFDVEPKIKVYHLYPRLDAWIGRILPDHVNPRSHDDDSLKGKVPEEIEATLKNNPEDFFLANRGETILADSLRFSQDTGIVEICLTEWEGENACHGVADGGTTDAVIARIQREAFEAAGLTFPTTAAEYPSQPVELPDYLKNARVHLEVIIGVKDREKIRRLVQGRNTSKAVKGWTLDDFSGNFDWIKAELESEHSAFKGRIGYEENSTAPARILSVIAVLTLFHQFYNKATLAPTVAYSSIGTLNKRLTNEHSVAGYKALAPILADLLELHDFVYAKFEMLYKEARPGSRMGAIGSRERKIFPEKEHILPFTGVKVDREVPNGFIYPLLASMRALVEYEGGEARWIRNPKEFLLDHGCELLTVLLEQFNQVKENPNALGKAKPAYTETFTMAENILMKELLKMRK